MATPTAAPESWRCSTVLSQIRLRLSNRNWMASTNVCMSGPTCPRPRRQDALEQDEQSVGHQCQEHGQQSRGHELRLEPALDRVEDRLSQASDADERGDRGEADRGHRRDPDSGHDGGQGQWQLDTSQDLLLGQAHRARRNARVLGYLAQAGQRVAEENEQGVRDQRDLRAGSAQARDRHHQLEEREARDRVEEGGEDRERRLEPAPAVGDERRGERDHESDPDGNRRQLDVLDQARPEHAVEVVEEPVGAELAVLADTLASALELRDHRLLGDDRDHTPTVRFSGPISRVIVSSVTVPFGAPLESSTVSRSVPSTSIIERASRRLVSSGALGPAAPSPAGSSSSSLSVHTRRRFRPRSAPTKSATNSLAGSARMWSGVSYCTSSPSRRIAIRLPILMASSMSWVTKTTVFGTSAWRRRKSSCRRSRAIGSTAPNGSSMSISGWAPAHPRAPLRGSGFAPFGHAPKSPERCGPGRLRPTAGEPHATAVPDAGRHAAPDAWRRRRW